METEMQEEIRDKVIIPPFEPDRNSRGVYLVFHGLVSQARPDLANRRILLLWTVCRGITDEDGWAKACYDAGYSWSLNTLRSDMLHLIFTFLGLLPLLNGGEARTRKEFIQDKLPALIRSVWGLYDLAWGHPITSRMPTEAEIREELKGTGEE